MLTWEPTLTLNSCVTLWLYINGPPDDVICDIAIYADDTTLYSKCDQAFDLWQQLIVGKGVPAPPPPFLRHAPFVPVCPPFSKSLCPIPYFLFHPLSRYFRQSPPSHANPFCHNPTNQPFWFRQISKGWIYHFSCRFLSKIIFNLLNPFTNLNLWNSFRFIFRQLRKTFSNKIMGTRSNA